MTNVSNDLDAKLKKSSTYSHTWEGLNPQIGGAIGLFYFFKKKYTFGGQKGKNKPS
jgi:hypothetical protein